MQRHSKKSLQLTKKLGELIRRLRTEKNISGQKFAFEYDIDKSNLNRTEHGLIDCKFTSFFKISQALGLKPSALLKLLEEELGENFSLIDE